MNNNFKNTLNFNDILRFILWLFGLIFFQEAVSSLFGVTISSALNFPIIVFLYLGLFYNEKLGLILSFILGIICDIVFGVHLGLWSSIAILVFLIISFLRSLFFLESGLLLLFIVLIISFLSNIFYWAMLHFWYPNLSFNLISIAYGALFVSLISPIIIALMKVSLRDNRL